jgi:hypothetical protein
MIYGVIRFLFRKLPKWIWEFAKWIQDLLIQWFPTFTKFLWVSLLFILVMGGIFGPGFYALPPVAYESIGLHPLFGNSVEQFWIRIVCFVWSITTSVGAIFFGIFSSWKARSMRRIVTDALKDIDGDINTDESEVSIDSSEQPAPHIDGRATGETESHL